MKYLTLSILLMFITTSVYAHEDPLGEIPWPEGTKVPCRCDILAIDYEQCLKGIGREECFKIVEPKEPKCSNNVKPGTVVQTYPPIYNCEDLKRKNSLEARVKELEEKIRKLEKD